MHSFVRAVVSPLFALMDAATCCVYVEKSGSGMEMKMNMTTDTTIVYVEHDRTCVAFSSNDGQ